MPGRLRCLNPPRLTIPKRFPSFSLRDQFNQHPRYPRTRDDGPPVEPVSRARHMANNDFRNRARTRDMTASESQPLFGRRARSAPNRLVTTEVTSR